MKIKKYQVLVKSTGGFIVEAENEVQAEEMVLDHMLKMGTPFLSGSVEYRESESPYAYPIRLSIACDGSGDDKVLSISTVAESEVMPMS
jgi:hypothetical protein